VGKGRKPLPSREVSQFIRCYVAPENKNKRQLSSEEIVERVLFPLVNEGFKILEEGIADKPSDIDVIYLYGYGWPSWRGGPMFWADHEVGLPYLLETLKSFSKQYPGSEYFVPSRLLETCVSMNVAVEEYYKRGLHKSNRSKL
jgi:3-hydroxyacyl-CoA dehydrogenase